MRAGQYNSFVESNAVGKTVAKLGLVDDGKCVSIVFADGTSILVDSGGTDDGSLVLQARNQRGEVVLPSDFLRG